MRHQTESSDRTVLTLENGRMVILARTEAERANTETLAELARQGKEEGYALFTECIHNHLGPDDAPGLSLSILVRPSIHAQKAGMLSAIAAVAVARAVERISDLTVRIRWVNDLFCGTRKLAVMMTNARITPGGYLDYAVIGVSVALPPEYFKPKLGDIVTQVFSGDMQPLGVRLTEHILEEFFLLYDKMTVDSSYMEEYRARSMILNRRVRVLVGSTYVRGRVCAIDDHAHLVVELRKQQICTVDSPSKVLFR